MGKKWKLWQSFFSCVPKSLWMVTIVTKSKDGASWKESYDTPRQCFKRQRYLFADKGPYSQSYGFSSSHVWMWELDHKEGWVLKNWCFWTVVLEKTLESPLDCKEIKPINAKENQPWICIRRTDNWIYNTLATWCKELIHFILFIFYFFVCHTPCDFFIAEKSYHHILGPGALGRPRGSGWRGRWEGGLGWGTHVNSWLFHFNVWQNSLQANSF